jgi:hypothetical protein
MKLKNNNNSRSVSNIFLNFDSGTGEMNRTRSKNESVTRFNLTLVKFYESEEYNKQIKKSRNRDKYEIVLPSIIKKTVDVNNHKNSTPEKKIFSSNKIVNSQSSNISRYRSLIKQNMVTYGIKGLSLNLDKNKVYPFLHKSLIKDIDNIARMNTKQMSNIYKK